MSTVYIQYDPRKKKRNASLSTAQSQARTGDGPSGSAGKAFSFITITDPAQAQNQKNKRSVRSHAMFDYAANKRRGQVGSGDTRLVRQKATESRLGDAGSTTSLTRPFSLEFLTGMAELRATTTESNGKDVDQAAEEAHALELSRYHRVLRRLGRHDANDEELERVIVQDDATFELAWKSGACRPYVMRCLAGQDDPFDSWPTFKSREVDMAKMKMWSVRRYGTPAMTNHWIPAFAQHRHTYLSAMSLSFFDMEVENSVKEPAPLSIAVKTEIIGLVNEQLVDPATQYADATIMSIIFLLCNEVLSGDEWIWDVHDKALTRMISRRGGFHTLGVGGDLANSAVGMHAIVNILRESPMEQMYKAFVALRMPPISIDKAIPESPVLCPRSDFYTIVRDKHCTEGLYDLLCDMRDLTDMFLAHGSNGEGESTAAISASTYALLQEVHGSFQSREDVDRSARKILGRVQALRSFDPDTDAPSYGGWMFEACRIASLIWATAIAERVSLSEAAILVDAQNHKDGTSTAQGALPACLHDLREAVRASHVAECWSDLVGVHLWVCMIGSAAARKSEKCIPNWEKEDGWTRKYLITVGLRSSIVTIFEHGLPILTSLRRMNKVQELLVKPECSLAQPAKLEEL